MQLWMVMGTSFDPQLVLLGLPSGGREVGKFSFPSVFIALIDKSAGHIFLSSFLKDLRPN